MTRLWLALIMCSGLTVAFTGGSQPAAAQGLNYFYCYAPDPQSGKTYVSNVHQVGPVAERSRYGDEFVAHLKSKGLVPRGTTGYCTMRRTMGEIDRGRAEMAHMTCPECEGADKLEDVSWPRGKAAVKSEFVSKQAVVSDSVSVRQAANDTALADGKLVLSEGDAAKVLKFFFGSLPDDLDENDRRFAQSLILESARSSEQMGYAEALFRSATSPTATPTQVIRDIGRQVLHGLAEPDTVQSAMDREHYGAVVNQFRLKWKSSWAERIQLEDSSMLAKLWK